MFCCSDVGITTIHGPQCWYSLFAISRLYLYAQSSSTIPECFSFPLWESQNFQCCLMLLSTVVIFLHCHSKGSLFQVQELLRLSPGSFPGLFCQWLHVLQTLKHVYKLDVCKLKVCKFVRSSQLVLVVDEINLKLGVDNVSFILETCRHSSVHVQLHLVQWDLLL